jgi:hypothetical protein
MIVRASSMAIWVSKIGVGRTLAASKIRSSQFPAIVPIFMGLPPFYFPRGFTIFFIKIPMQKTYQDMSKKLNYRFGLKMNFG